MTNLSYCEELIHRPASSLYYALLTASEAQRPHLVALIALHKELNHVLIECKEVSVARIKLNWWRNELITSLEGQASHPVTKALSSTGALIQQAQNQAAGAIAQLQAELLQWVEAAELDLSQGRYLDLPNLEHYLELNATSFVRVLMQQLLGVERYHAEQHDTLAAALAKAMALTIIVRDIGLHSIQGRIYIPMSDLRQFGVTAHQIQQRQYDEKFKQLVDFQVERIESYFKEAEEALSTLDRSDSQALRPLLCMASMHKALLKQLQKQPERVLEERVSLSPLKKAWIAQKHKWSIMKL